VTTLHEIPTLVAHAGTAIWWIIVTVVVYLAARALYGWRRRAWLNPAIVAIGAVIVILLVSHTPYVEYDRGGHLITLLLGPAVVALGFPLAEQLPLLRRHARGIALALLAGSIVGILAGAGIALALGGSGPVVRSLASRSVTTPIAMAIAARIGGIPALSALVSIATGAIGGAIGPELLRALGVRSRIATGLALGTAAHGLGTARAVDEGAVEAAASSVGMGLNGIVTAVLVPLVIAIAVGMHALSLSSVTSSATADSVITVRIDATHGPVATFVPSVAFGAALDGLEHGGVAATYTPHNLAAMESAGLVPITYRLRTELGIEAWHWNPHGTWSDAAHQRGYWTSDTTATAPIMVSYGYRLPRRGNSIDQANDAGYSRLDDGDTATFWKSNPYLDERYTGEPATNHPHWIVLDFRAVVPVDAIRIHWAAPYATSFTVQRWAPTDSDDARQMRENPGDENIASGHWVTFDHGMASGHGGDQLLRVADRPVDTRLIRVLMTGTSHTALPGSIDPRDSIGVAIREVYAGTLRSDGSLSDVMRHGRTMATQTITYASSTDPWHRASDVDPDTEQPGFDRVYRSGITRGRSMLVPVGVLYDTPDNAAASLRFLRARGYPITGVEMGEEPDGQGVAPADYAALYLVFADALHRVTPSVALGAAGFQDMVPYPSIWPDDRADRSWIRPVLAVLRAHGRVRDLAFYSFERYPYDDVCGPVLPQIATAPLQFAAAVDSLRQLGVPRDIPWLITEYGYSAFAGQPEVEMSTALLDADIVGQFLLAGGRTAYLFGYRPTSLMRNGDCDSWGDNAILLANGAGEATQPVAAYYGTRLTTQVWAQPGDGAHALFRATSDAPTIAGGPAVTEYAVHRPDGRWAVMLLNKEPTRTLSVRIALAGSTGDQSLAGPLELFQYSAAQYQWHPDGANGHAAPDLPPARRMLSPRDSIIALPPTSMTVVRSTRM